MLGVSYCKSGTVRKVRLVSESCSFAGVQCWERFWCQEQVPEGRVLVVRVEQLQIVGLLIINPGWSIGFIIGYLCKLCSQDDEVWVPISFFHTAVFFFQFLHFIGMVNLFLTSTGDFIQQDLIWWLGSMIHFLLGQAICQFSRANLLLVSGECNPNGLFQI